MQETKLCPFCKEEIKRDAIKCKHCGSMLTDTKGGPLDVSAPPSEPPSSSRSDGQVDFDVALSYGK